MHKKNCLYYITIKIEQIIYFITNTSVIRVLYECNIIYLTKSGINKKNNNNNNI